MLLRATTSALARAPRASTLVRRNVSGRTSRSSADPKSSPDIHIEQHLHQPLSTSATPPPPQAPPREAVKATVAEAYSQVLSLMHWLVAPAFIGSIGAVLQAQQVKGKEKGVWMHRYVRHTCVRPARPQLASIHTLCTHAMPCHVRHKSLGLLAGILVAPRFFARLASKAPGPLEGTHALEQAAAKVSHLAMYIFMGLMPATGIAMGYYGALGVGRPVGRSSRHCAILLGRLPFVAALSLIRTVRTHERATGGKGLPFFWTTISGAATANGDIAKQSFSIHKTLGTYGASWPARPFRLLSLHSGLQRLTKRKRTHSLTTGKYLVPLHVGAAGLHFAKGQAIFARINPFR